MPARSVLFPGLAIAQMKRTSVQQRARIAEQAADDARSAAPVESGEFRDGIDTEILGGRVFLVDNDPEATYKEYGTLDTPPHATLTNAASHYGKYTGWRA